MNIGRRTIVRLVSIYAAVNTVEACITSRTFVEPLIAHGLLFGAIGVAAIVMIRNTRRTVRSSEGRCIYCGYDLRATPRRCPECGMLPAPVV